MTPWTNAKDAIGVQAFGNLPAHVSQPPANASQANHTIQAMTTSMYPNLPAWMRASHSYGSIRMRAPWWGYMSKCNEVNHLQGQNATLTNQHQQITTQHQQLTTQHHQLTAQNQQLQDQYQQLTVLRDCHVKEVQRLSDEAGGLRSYINQIWKKKQTSEDDLKKELKDKEKEFQVLQEQASYHAHQANLMWYKARDEQERVLALRKQNVATFGAMAQLGECVTRWATEMKQKTLMESLTCNTNELVAGYQGHQGWSLAPVAAPPAPAAYPPISQTPAAYPPMVHQPASLGEDADYGSAWGEPPISAAASSSDPTGSAWHTPPTSNSNTDLLPERSHKRRRFKGPDSSSDLDLQLADLVESGHQRRRCKAPEM